MSSEGLTADVGSQVAVTRERRGRWERSSGLLRLAIEDRLALAGLIVLSVLIVLAVFGPLLWPQDPLAVKLSHTLQPPSFAHPMGTDGVGRDVFARFCAGARTSLIVATMVVLVSGVAGGAIGLVAGLSRGLTGVVLMRAMDAILAFPPLVLAMAVTLGLGAGVTAATIGIAITTVPYFARIIRSDVLRIRGLPLVEATVALGASKSRLIGRHVLPATLPTVLVLGTAAYGDAILTLAGLGFIGLGVQPPAPEWGTMITQGLQYALSGQWWVGVFPGLGVLGAVVGISLIGDRMRDLIDPTGTALGS
ncbi:MAG TPA: ABC transporter permease [Conexibacter sp.]|nr:ABC transporter permease [Conexibacter sp.]